MRARRAQVMPGRGEHVPAPGVGVAFRAKYRIRVIRGPSKRRITRLSTRAGRVDAAQRVGYSGMNVDARVDGGAGDVETARSC